MQQLEVFDLMHQRGYAKVIVEFSGGNDDGDVDGITAYDVDGKPVARLQEEHYYGLGPKSLDTLLAEAVVQPVYDEYSSFAGEFFVHGTVTWDLETKEVNMDDHLETPDAYSDEADY